MNQAMISIARVDLCWVLTLSQAGIGRLIKVTDELRAAGTAPDTCAAFEEAIAAHHRLMEAVRVPSED
ncbi:MAG: hypothetical protein KJ604_20695 [Gammaproteobacteria bacterium]|nr:hypothetical protein [Gammaproteobacteria bacterium]